MYVNRENGNWAMYVVYSEIFVCPFKVSVATVHWESCRITNTHMLLHSCLDIEKSLRIFFRKSL